MPRRNDRAAYTLTNIKSSLTRALLRKLKFITYKTSQSSDQEAAVTERLNFTIKIRLLTFICDRGTVRLVDVLENLVRAYNHMR